jgi:large subunit ribosomal protein L40e
VSPILDLTRSGTAPFDPESQLLVKTLTGEEYGVDFQSWDTVENLKRDVERKTAVPAEDQRLIYEGRQLQDGRMLSGQCAAIGSTFISSS